MMSADSTIVGEVVGSSGSTVVVVVVVGVGAVVVCPTERRSGTAVCTFR